MAWALGRAQPLHSAWCARLALALTAYGQYEHLQYQFALVIKPVGLPFLACISIWTCPRVKRVLPLALLAFGAIARGRRCAQLQETCGRV